MKRAQVELGQQVWVRVDNIWPDGWSIATVTNARTDGLVTVRVDGTPVTLIINGSELEEVE